MRSGVLIIKARSVFQEFPRTFWVLVGASFIDRLGGALIFPFLSLYIATRFQVGMTKVGLLLAIWSVSGMVGNIFGGAMTDKFGRRFMLIFGLVFSASTALALGFANDLRIFFVILAGAGFLSDIGGPAHGAMVADLLPEKQRPEGFGILRVTANLAVVFGPAIGGVLAGVSYLLLFIIDACASIITAGIVFFALPETKPAASADHPSDSLLKTIKGYRKVAKDKLFMAYIFCLHPDGAGLYANVQHPFGFSQQSASSATPGIWLLDEHERPHGCPFPILDYQKD